MKKVYYKLTLTQTSPLHISNGDADSTDKDLMKDGRGIPFIPGSSLTGVLRSMLPEQKARELFGFVNGRKQSSGIAIVSDAVPEEGALFHMSFRDGVGIDNSIYSTAQDNMKYNFEVVESDKPYTCVIECSREDADFEALLQQIAEKGIRLGGKTTRGYGSMSVTAQKRVFDFSCAGTINDWLDFDPWSTAYTDSLKSAGSRSSHYTRNLPFIIDGSFLIRVYKSDPNIPKFNEAVPDYVPLSQKDGKPVIPGTSWAGSFRHRMLELAREAGCEESVLKEINLLFGVTESKNEHLRSGIIFSESVIDGGNNMVITRNRLDRFTAAPVTTALYTSEVHYGGKGTLSISVARPDFEGSLLESLLDAAINDMNMGLLTIGGEAGVGRGLIKLEEEGEPA